jgi:FAD/FMN-containing dehydrogenase
MVIDHIHGAAARQPPTATAFAHRREGYSLLTISQWANAADDEQCIAWAKDTYRQLQPALRPDAYVNYLDQDDRGQTVVAAYGENYPRLRDLKRRFDPANLFRMNRNITPS